MSNVQFEEQTIIPRFHQEEKVPTFNRLVMKTGLAKDKRGADVVLVAIIIISIIVAIGTSLWGTKEQPPISGQTKAPIPNGSGKIIFTP